MSGTSWWWFALMTEAISFSVQAEIPITIVLSQRAWPSTWTPTYHETADINFALYPTFWDFEHIVLYPSNLEETYYFAWLALNIADKYQTQVILLMDKQASELHWTTEKLEAPKIERWVIMINDKWLMINENEKTSYFQLSAPYKRYEITENWISPRVKVWTKNWDFIASSYEHDEYWATTENPEIKKKMTEKRFKKLNNFFQKEWYKGYEIINWNAKKMIIVSWFTSYTAKKFVNDNPLFWLIIIKFLKPLDIQLKEELIWKEELIFIENNYSGQIENYITKEFGLIDCKLPPTPLIEGGKTSGLKISHLRKYDLMPFYIEDFESLL
jgi:2-oxoglutarate ferredoxin oxidoreductase subunit alpha